MRRTAKPRDGSPLDPRPKRRLYRKICIFSLLLLGAPVLYYFDVHLIVIGYLRNEPCYRSRPATYWGAQIQSRHRWNRHSNEAATRVLITLLAKVNVHPTLDTPIREGDVRALPVLLFLLKDSDPDVRSYAVGFLGMINPPEERTIAAIIEALDDEDFHVRVESIYALGNLGPSARAAVPRLIRLSDQADLLSDQGLLGRVARDNLAEIDPEALKSLKPFNEFQRFQRK